MFIALTNNQERISIDKAISGEFYTCPVCHKQVTIKATNSTSIRTHFAHKPNSFCFDNWKHDMSDWHFEWQSKFPIENREVVVEKEEVIHRADILINNTVIEFQHSPISNDEFEERNCFYKKCGLSVVWLFDATDKMKIDDCFGLVWKRKTTLFSSMRTPIDAFYIQHCLPEDKDEIKLLLKPDSKDVEVYHTIHPILPCNFLKEYGALKDENIDSIFSIMQETKQKQLEKRIIQNRLNEERQRMASIEFEKRMIAAYSKKRGRF